MSTDSPPPGPSASHRSIIDRWPSLRLFAADVGVSYGGAKAMRRRNSIPLEHVSAVVAAARRRGLLDISAELIAELAAARGQRANPLPVAEGDVCHRSKGQSHDQAS